MATELVTIDSSLTLKEAYEKRMGDPQSSIPWVVWLVENPLSPLPFPGKISLEGHDILHILLDLDRSPENEAYVVGFTLGNDPHTKAWHLAIFKWIARYLYPEPYRFQPEYLSVFDRGFIQGRQSKRPALNRLDLTAYIDFKIGSLREALIGGYATT